VLLLVIFSLLAMAQKGDEDQDELEYKLSQGRIFPPYAANPGTADEARAAADSKVAQGSGAEGGILLSR
jgi:hypothetical protein